MKSRKILVFSRDPGGTNAVMQLITPLRTHGNEVVVYGKDAALSIYRRFGMECADIRDAIPSGTQRETNEFLQNESPDLIVTGTSSEDFSGRHLWQAADDWGIPSFAVLDQWTNYRLRLIPEAGAPTKTRTTDDTLVMPSRFFIMDEFARKEMCALGIANEKLVVTGQPFFDHIRRTGSCFSAQEIEKLREKLTVGQGGLVFVFASQPLVSIHRQNGMADDYWGYTEITVLKAVTACLGKLTNESGTKVTLVIRLHPKDDANAYQDALTIPTESIQFVFDRETDSSLLLKSADLIIGMFSMLLLEAAILGRPFTSVQIGLKRESPLVFDRMGLDLSILTDSELEESFREILNGEFSESADLPFEFGATSKIVDYLERY